MDPTDGQLDIGNWLLTKRGFLLNPIVITEPSIGYGGGAAILFFHGNEPSEGAASAEGDKGSAAAAASRPKPPSVSFLLGAGTETNTWLAGGGHFGSFFADRLRYVGAVGYASVNIDFYIGDTGIEYNMEAPFILQELQVRLGESNWFLGGRYLYSTLESEFDFGVTLPSFIPDSLTFDMSGIGPILHFDSRDNLFTANDGIELEITPLFYTQTLGSDQTFQALSTRLRIYKQVHERLVLAGRFDSSTSFGDVPFFALPTLQARGVPAARYQNEYAISSEVQARWRAYKRWSLIGFVGLGWIDGDIPGLEDNKFVPSGGGGFRYLIARVLDLHTGMDFAGSEDEFVFYFQVGTGF